MSAKHITIDALSRALCPSIDARLLSRAISLPLTSAGRVRGTRNQHGIGSAQRCCAGQIRTAHNSPARVASGKLRLYPQWSALPEQTEPITATEPWGPESEIVKAITLCQLDDGLPTKVLRATTPALYEALRSLRRYPKQGANIRRLVKYLVEERDERPNVFLYEALVVANWDTTTGSAADLAEIFKEIRTARLEPSQGWYHSALRLLAIHPDYLMRNTLLQRMQDQGIELGGEGKWSVALGLLRDDQVEMAMEYWDQMRKEGTEIPGWVGDIFTYVLAMRGSIDEAMELFHQRLDMAAGDSSAVPLVTWSYLLDECSKALHYEGTKFIWDNMAQPGTINLPDGVALNVLNTAAHRGDTGLATAVVEFLSARQVKLGLHHYEPLMESYVRSGGLENAFRVLGIMHDIGIQPDQSSTRPIFQMLKSSPGLIDEAVGILGSVENLPSAALTVVLEALVKTEGISKALDVYRKVCDLHSGPNQQTFVLLLDECSTSEPAVFLVSEMDRFSVRPSQGILDNLIRCFATDGNLDVALLYLGEISGLSADPRSWVSEHTLEVVARRCLAEKDDRIQWLLAEAHKRGMGVTLAQILVKLGEEPEFSEKPDLAEG